MAEVVPIHPPAADQRLRRKTGQIRFSHSHPERRKKRSAGFDIAAALELNLDRSPAKDGLLGLLERWLRAAEREGLAARLPDYVAALRRAISVMVGARNAEDAIQALQDR